MNESDLDWMVRSVHAREAFLEECYRRVKNAAKDVINAHKSGADAGSAMRKLHESMAWREHIRQMAEGNRAITKRLDELIMSYEPYAHPKGKG